MKKCKITVLKTTFDKELAEEYGVKYLFLSFTYLRLSFEFFITHTLHTKNSH